MAESMINLYSDTQTLPTAAMYDAMRAAPLGDDQQQLDPTVNRLERLAADLLGKPAALLVISGMMGNLCGLMSQAGHGDEMLLDPDSHIWFYEAGSYASIAGLSAMPVAAPGGLMSPAALRAALRPENLHFPTPRLLCLENTHNRAGGRVVPLELHRELCEIAHDAGLRVHLDGARLFNAQVASGVPAAQFAACCDSVQFCLSKGLSCPIGSLLVGDVETIERARRVRKRLGGAMRQAGLFAAAGIVALETMIDRLADDHANARRLAEGLASLPGLRLDMDSVQTNMVYVDISATGLGSAEAADRLLARGVMASTPGAAALRFVTHRHISPADVDEAVRRTAAALAG